jgi:hypothetical protein
VPGFLRVTRPPVRDMQGPMNSPAKLCTRFWVLLFGVSCSTILAWLVFYFGIYLGYGNWKVKGHQDFARSGLSQIQPASEMASLFEDCRHYIVYSGRNSISTWNSTAFFGGRYTLTMQVPVAIASSHSGHVTGEPEFLLLEVSAVDVSPSGQVGASFGRQIKFGAKEWKTVVDHKGDFSKIGFPIESRPAIKDFDRYAKASR